MIQQQNVIEEVMALELLCPFFLCLETIRFSSFFGFFRFFLSYKLDDGMAVLWDMKIMIFLWPQFLHVKSSFLKYTTCLYKRFFLSTSFSLLCCCFLLALMGNISNDKWFLEGKIIENQKPFTHILH